MGIAFNADEVFEMAERIEEDGAAFYRKAAGGQSDGGKVQFLNGLAAMEDEHKQTFAAMRAGLGAADKESTTFDPDGEAALYLQAMADGHGGEGAPKAADALTGKESLADILTIAIGLEKKSILFYLGLKDMVPARLGKDKIDRIIDEERGHVGVLSRELRGL
ncbi:MAG: ferritin family protein [Kiritimatiellae bacterium]|nr:ferritin family protein [Kiritimatiellia bacterium]